MESYQDDAHQSTDVHNAHAHVHGGDPVPKPRSRGGGSGVAVAFAGEEELRVTRKMDQRILPFVLLAYLFQQLDKSTLMYASVFGLADDANLVGKQLSWLGSILYVAQLLAQPIAAAALVEYPLGKVIAVAILLWGLTLCLMSSCTTFFSLLCTRFLLGAFESIIGLRPSSVPLTAFHNI